MNCPDFGNRRAPSLCRGLVGCLLAAAPLSAVPAFAAAGEQQAQARVAANRAEEDRILSLMQAWAVARKSGDAAFLERFYAPEFQVQSMNGAIVSRADDISAFAKGLIKPELIEDEDMQVRIYGDTAVVTGIEHLKGTAFGNPGEFRLRFTNVFVKTAGTWRLVIHQSTPIP